MARWFLQLLGGFDLNDVSSGGSITLPGKRERVLLAYLALAPHCRAPRRKLASLLWGDAGDATALDNLRVCVWGLRKALGDVEHCVIRSESEDIVLDATAFDVDVLSLRRSAAEMEIAELEATAKHYSGEFLEGLSIGSEEFESWRRLEATRCMDQAVDVLSRLMAKLLEARKTERAIDAGTRILRLEPMHEAAIRSLMRLYGGSGRRGTAIALYRTLAEALHKEFKADPEAETRAVLAEISHGSEERVVAPAASRDKLPGSTIALPNDTSPMPDLFVHVPGAPQKIRAGKLGWVFAGGLAVALALILTPRDRITNSEQVLNNANSSTFSEPSGISIAVLPFGNLSGDARQEFFSDGMTAEITAALAKVRDLQVIARVSAFQFKGVNTDMRAVGRALGARYLIDGSVRSAGNRVRITVQLIRTDTGVNVWSETYDRELIDVFAIQESIAEAIAGELMVPLGLKPGQMLVASRIADPQIYEQYLRAMAQYRSTSPSAAAMLEAVVAGAPAFAPAWAALAGAYRRQAGDARRRGDDIEADLRFTEKEETAARKAIQVDPAFVGGYTELAAVQSRRGKWADAEDLYKQALSLDPNYGDLLHTYSLTLAALGRLKEALILRQKLRALEPMVPNYNVSTADVMLLNGEVDATILLLEPDPSTGVQRNASLALAYAAKGRFADAAETLLRVTTGIDRRRVEDATILLRSAPGKNDLPAKLPRLGSELAFVYAYVGAPERLLDYSEEAAKDGNKMSALLWNPVAAPLRKMERFKALTRSVGLVDYWRARGWPDLCRPVGADDFECN